MEYFFVGGILAFFFVASWLVYRAERRVWNGGLCAKCYTFWTMFDMDSQGGRGYRCSGCAETRRIWISWPGVDRQKSVTGT